ncbi:precorrin-6A synthase [Amaricoccus macauensis]|uniref:Precorrin-6A synthase [deacetylating] n=1 Tax=Amaricoccus macauensis TaxID=57001 RepID=A0A840SY75_9RHOB|nr:precorrin-6A synthase (deacetylating) [Amaricoccus macauensis]MBB5224022.1 precorrin-6A synthase [Amaricoccus macauensis]
MLGIVVIGIGTGNPDHMTVEAIGALNAADLVLIPRKGAAKGDLADLRRAICERFLENPATRIVEFDMPVRDTSGGYRAGVEVWHAAISARYRHLLDGETGTAALLVWGDPSLYDSTLRILDLLAAGGLAFTRRVVPGITSLQVLAARHAIPLNHIGEPVAITTGRQLATGGATGTTTAVMLDGDCAFRGIDPEGVEIFWGAYLGMENEILISGPLADVGDAIVAARAEARAANGWIMDTYLLRCAGESASASASHSASVPGSPSRSQPAE